MATTTSYLAQLVTIQYIVDSEEDEPQAGWLYSNILQKLRGQPEMKAANLSKLIVDEYESWYRNNRNILLDRRAT